jgi:hypothetical protein
MRDHRQLQPSQKVDLYRRAIFSRDCREVPHPRRLRLHRDASSVDQVDEIFGQA